MSFTEFPIVHDGIDSAVVITGANSGIGLSAAKRLQSEGFYVFAGCRKSTDCTLLRTLGLEPLLIDVTDSETIDKAVMKVRASGKILSAIVNNAGTTTKKPLETVAMSTVKHVFNVNVLGALEVTQKFLPLLRETRKMSSSSRSSSSSSSSSSRSSRSSRSSNGARIIFIGSVSGIISLRLNGVYSMTKYSLEAMADTFRRELYKFGIVVSMVNPAYVNTNFRQIGVETLQDQSEKEKKLYSEEFKRLEQKMIKRVSFAAPCCNVTDDAIMHAISSKYPKTRYYPAVVAPHVPASLMTPLIRSLGVFTWTDRLLDMIVLKFF